MFSHKQAENEPDLTVKSPPAPAAPSTVYDRQHREAQVLDILIKYIFMIQVTIQADSSAAAPAGTAAKSDVIGQPSEHCCCC